MVGCTPCVGHTSRTALLELTFVVNTLSTTAAVAVAETLDTVVVFTVPSVSIDVAVAVGVVLGVCVCTFATGVVDTRAFVAWATITRRASVRPTKWTPRLLN